VSGRPSGVGEEATLSLVLLIISDSISTLNRPMALGSLCVSGRSSEGLRWTSLLH